MIRRMLSVAVLAIALLVWAVPAGASSFTWSGPVNGDWVAAANWTPGGFVNDAAHAADVCDINAGGQAQNKVASTTFYPRLNVNSSAILDIGGYMGNNTISNLHLNGGTLQMGSSTNLAGAIAADAASLIKSGGGDNNNISAVFSGSGNVSIISYQTGTRSLAMSGSNPSYSGTWIYSGTGTGQVAISGNPGTGTLRVDPGLTYIRIGLNTGLNWILDMQGKTAYVTGQYAGTTHTGQVTLLSNAILVCDTDYDGKNATFNGKITGTGKLFLKPTSNNNRKIILGSNLNDYSGGTELVSYTSQAKVAHSLGTGDVRVDSGATLEVLASGVMDPTAELYLDYNGTSYGKANLAASTITTILEAWIGGTGGWEAPLGYTALLAGDYTASSPGMSTYLLGTGILRVTAPAGPVPEPQGIALVLAGLALLRRRR